MHQDIAIFERRMANTCHFHGEGALKIENLEKASVRTGVKVDKMSRNINIGIGIALSACLVISLILMNMDTVEANVKQEIAAHELVIASDQLEVNTKLEDINIAIDSLQVQTTLLGARMEDLKQTIVEDRKQAKDDLKELKGLLGSK